MCAKVWAGCQNGAGDQYDVVVRESPLKGNISKVASQVVMCDVGEMDLDRLRL